ncbi:MAG TPA: class I SAM-dependent methyltransferase [Pirellulales bacterium]|nr:class I SAM-dependent methyltransferase [Pirellulales bacterium]
MNRKTLLPRRRRKKSADQPGKRRILKLVENDLINRVSYDEYRDRVRDVYGGPQGALLATASFLSLHIQLGDRLLRERRFDLRGARAILDVGSGAGQIAKHLLKYADHDARITCCDLSPEMLRRARNRLKNPLPSHVAADLSRLPFADESFDCITCGYVLEHLPDARLGLAELSRVMRPGGRMLLLTTEDNFSGAWTSRFWCCRTYNRQELRRTSEELGMVWKQELWFTRMHKLLKAGGICVEIEKQ